MKIEFIGAAHEVTGSCHYIEYGSKHFLVDCGMEQGPDLYENQDLPVLPGEIDYCLITHAHIDHSGKLPLLYKRGFRGKIYATKATCELCNIMLKDSAHIQEFEAEWKNRKARRSGGEEIVPMYTLEDVLGVLECFVPCDYDEEIDVDENLRVCFRDAGHLLGSACIEAWVSEGKEERKIIFSGDIGQGNKPLLRRPAVLQDADYVLIESTYGDRLHEAVPDYAAQLAREIRRTFTKGGNVVIPAFSVGRTQEMLYYLRRIKTEGLLPEFGNFEVYIDSPLAVEATGIFHENVSECFSEEAKKLVAEGINPIRFPGLKVSVTSDDSKAINFIDHPVVILSASGMCEAGRIRHHLKHNLWRPESTVLFVGYQVPGTIGHALLNGAKEVKLFGETIAVQADIVQLPGLSGHADKDHLVSWAASIAETPVRKFFVVHGEDRVTDDFAQILKEKLGVIAEAPYSGDVYDLLTGEKILSGNAARKEKKKTAASARVSSVFLNLMAAGERLLSVIRRCEGYSNKDLAKFAGQINALSDKWDPKGGSDRRK